jgi:ketosteroid isomerase-like protein
MAEGKNVEVVRRGYRAFNERDVDAFREYVHPDFELDFTESRSPNRGTYTGIEGVRQLFSFYWEAFESFTLEPEDFIEADDVVIAVVHGVGRGRSSGVDVEVRGPHLWTFRDGRVVGFALYQELPEALDAAGLSE